MISAPRKEHPFRARACRANPPHSASWTLPPAGKEARSRGKHLHRWALARQERGEGVASRKERKGSKCKGPRPGHPEAGRRGGWSRGLRGRDNGAPGRRVEEQKPPGLGFDGRAVALSPGETGATGLIGPTPRLQAEETEGQRQSARPGRRRLQLRG